MPSAYGRKRALPGYDKFRTGLTFADVQKMLWVASEDPKDWKHKSRGVVLWHWHMLKMQMYEMAVGRGYARED